MLHRCSFVSSPPQHESSHRVSSHPSIQSNSTITKAPQHRTLLYDTETKSDCMQLPPQHYATSPLCVGIGTADVYMLATRSSFFFSLLLDTARVAAPAPTPPAMAPRGPSMSPPTTTPPIEPHAMRTLRRRRRRAFLSASDSPGMASAMSESDG
jgi:hypothetical protein